MTVALLPPQESPASLRAPNQKTAASAPALPSQAPHALATHNPKSGAISSGKSASTNTPSVLRPNASTASIGTADTENTAPAPVSPPPSSQLKFQTLRAHGSRVDQGTSVMRWRSTTDSFDLQGEININFQNILVFRSEGTLSRTALTPLKYSEQRGEQLETTTLFQHDYKQISFSSSLRNFPTSGGEQDAASVFWLLASTGRQNHSAFHQGVEFNTLVADSHKVDLWQIRVIGMEDILTPIGKLSTWHLVRTASSATPDQTVDLWLSPEHEWYPVKLRYTEANGDYLEMIVSDISPIPET